MTQPAGQLIVVSGPSGVGKTTLTHALADRLDAVFSVSMTTRPRTAVDREGVDYHFVEREPFERAIREGSLLEWAEVFGHYYGTPREPVEREIDRGRHVILEIDVSGGIQIRQKMPSSLLLFVLPPHDDELLRRLRNRRRESEDVIQRRFREAKREIDQARSSGAYDHFITNDEIGRAIEEVVDRVETRVARHPRREDWASGED